VYIQTRKCIWTKNSEEEDNFINNLMEAIKGMNTENIQSKEILDQIVQLLVLLKEYGINTWKLLISLNI